MRRKTNDKTGLSRVFHLNSEPYVDENSDQTPPLVQRAKSYADAPRIGLPVTASGPIDALARVRRSARAFADEPMRLDTLAALLRSGYGAIGPDALADGQRVLRRPVPSAGALYPLEIYALVQRVSGLETGIYHFDTVADDLALLSGDRWQAGAEEAFYSWSYLIQAPVVLCLGAEFERSQSKYGPRGYRYVLLEAGHVVQNLCLAAGGLGLSSLCLGGYRDSVLNGLIGLDGEKEAIVYCVALGQAAPA